MIQIEENIIMDTMVVEALENEGQRVSILHRIQIFIEMMVGRSRYARHAHPPRPVLIYTRRAINPLDEAGHSQPIADIHGIGEMRRRDHHIHSLPPRL